MVCPFAREPFRESKIRNLRIEIFSNQFECLIGDWKQIRRVKEVTVDFALPVVHNPEPEEHLRL